MKLQEIRYDDPVVQELTREVQAEYGRRYGGDGDVSPMDPAQFVAPRGRFFLASLALESGVPTRYTASLGLALLYQGVVVAGVLFLVNTWMLQIYKPSVLAAPALTTPLFGLVIARGVTGDPLTPALLASGVLVALGIGITTWRPRRALP